MPCSAAQRPIASTSAGGYTAPVGLLGETKSSALVRGVRAASSWSTVTRKPSTSVVGSTTGTPPPSAIVSGYVVQYGAGQEHLVARVAQHLEGVVDGVLAAVGDEHLGGGDVETRVALGLVRDRLAELGLARRRAVAMVPRIAARRDGRLDDVLRRREIGLPGAEADDVLTGGFQRLRTRVDRERRRLGDRGDSCRYPFHTLMVARRGRAEPKIRRCGA